MPENQEKPQQARTSEGLAGPFGEKAEPEEVADQLRQLPPSAHVDGGVHKLPKLPGVDSRFELIALAHNIEHELHHCRKIHRRNDEYPTEFAEGRFGQFWLVAVKLSETIPLPTSPPARQPGESITDVFQRLNEWAMKHVERDNAGENDADLSPVERALGLMVANPELSVNQIAERVKCNRSTLYRDARFKSAREAIRAGRKTDAAERRRQLPKGSKSETGDLEAW